MIPEKWKWKQIKKEHWILLLLVGILIMTLCIPTEQRSQDGENQYHVQTDITESRSSQGQDDELRRYEEQLENLLSLMDGAGKVKVMITESASRTAVVEKDQPYSIQMSQDGESSDSTKQQQENREETTVFERDSQGNETPYVSKTLAPEIEGILVLAQGGDNSVTAKNITESVMALFGIEAHKIKVMKMM